jgi:hypothetical protein
MLETGASGSVGGKGGNILVYPASVGEQVLRLRESAPKFSSSEAFVVMQSGGSIDVTVKARHIGSTGV